MFCELSVSNCADLTFLLKTYIAVLARVGLFCSKDVFIASYVYIQKILVNLIYLRLVT